MSIVQSGLETAMRAAVAAGRELMVRYDVTFRVEEKESLRDIVVEADRAAEERAIDVVSAWSTPASILSEEAGSLGDTSAKYQWIIDALDGTVNYVHQVPFFSVSIALLQGDNPIAGAIFAPVANDLYYAGAGLGAFKNDRRIEVVDRPLESSLLAAAFSGRGWLAETRAAEFRLFQAVNDSSRGCLRTGSAALNLAYLAEGRLNACWGRSNKIWDVAAGLIVAKEAGADVRSRTASEGSDLINYLAGTSLNANRLESLINAHMMAKQGRRRDEREG